MWWGHLQPASTAPLATPTVHCTLATADPWKSKSSFTFRAEIPKIRNNGKGQTRNNFVLCVTYGFIFALLWAFLQFELQVTKNEQEEREREEREEEQARQRA